MRQSLDPTKASTLPYESRAFAFLVFLVALAFSRGAAAIPDFLEVVPNNVGCLTCHNNPDGGEGCPDPPCWNDFGDDFFDAGMTWTPALAGADHDGDGCTSGQELGDPEGDGTLVVADYCARSPGLRTGQCERDGCCPEPEPARTRFMCECGESTPGVVCEPPPPPEVIVNPYLPNDLSGSPIPLLDATWTPVNSIGATSTEGAAECTLGGYDVWFSYRPDCFPGTITVEVETPSDIAILSETGTELACGARVTSLEVPAQRILIRVAGAERQTRIRATCNGDLTSTLDNATTCRNAEPIVGGTVSFNIGPGTRDGVSTHPDDICPMDIEHDYWFSYDAPCTGIATVEALFGREYDLSHCGFFIVEAAFGIFGPDACPSRTPLISCESVDVGMCGDVELISRQVNVLAGQRLYLRVGRRSPLSFMSLPGTLTVTCEETPVNCMEFCNHHAECHQNQPGRCTCEDGYVGDGVRPENGGTGCVLEEPCTDLGLDCTNGSCTFGLAGPTCECDAGYEMRGGACRDIAECAPGGIGGETCRLDRHHTRCVELVGSYACACEAGYSVDTSQDGFACRIICGDGLRGPGEVCDDGNLAGDDGCSPVCEEELGYRCMEVLPGPSKCEQTCGDGLIDPGEQCDDGNATSGDGCSPDCHQEFLVTLKGRPSWIPPGWFFRSCAVGTPGGDRRDTGEWALAIVIAALLGARRRVMRPVNGRRPR